MLLLNTRCRAARVLLCALACAMLSAMGIGAEPAEWKSASLDGGRLSVRYRISERAIDGGAKAPLIEDVSTTIAEVGFDSCLALLKDVAGHKDFSGDSSSRLLKTISDREWLILYESKNPWPLSDSDCVARMTLAEDAEAGSAVFKVSAAPDSWPMGKAKRMRVFEVSYSFRDLRNGSVEIVVSGTSSPPFEVPLWMIASSFPSVPADGLRKLVKLAQARK